MQEDEGTDDSHSQPSSKITLPRSVPVLSGLLSPVVSGMSSAWVGVLTATASISRSALWSSSTKATSRSTPAPSPSAAALWPPFSA